MYIVDTCIHTYGGRERGVGGWRRPARSTRPARQACAPGSGAPAELCTLSLSLYLSIYPSIYLSISLYMYVYIYVYIYIYIYIHIYIYIYTYTYTYVCFFTVYIITEVHDEGLDALAQTSGRSGASGRMTMPRLRPRQVVGHTTRTLALHYEYTLKSIRLPFFHTYGT